LRNERFQAGEEETLWYKGPDVPAKNKPDQAIEVHIDKPSLLKQSQRKSMKNVMIQEQPVKTSPQIQQVQIADAAVRR
jgi:hypothetical protein